MRTRDTKKSPDRRPPVTGMKAQVTEPISSGSGVSEPSTLGKEAQLMNTTDNPRQDLNLEAIRAKRAEDILNVGEATDDCTECGDPAGPSGLCNDCNDDDGQADDAAQERDEAPAEVERLREMHAKLRALYDRNVGSLVDQLDEATNANDRLAAENTLLGEALDDAIAENARLAAEVERFRNMIDGEVSRLRAMVDEIVSEIIQDVDGEVA